MKRPPSFRALNGATWKVTSYKMEMRWTGCEAGHGVNCVPSVYAMCDLWSAESRFTPSQQPGKKTSAWRPPGQSTWLKPGVAGIGGALTFRLIVNLELVTVEVYEKRLTKTN